MTPAADGWTKTVLYEFASGLYVVDGKYPLGGLIMDGAGSLYGTTFFGGANNGGAVFRLTPNQDGTLPWTETLLYSFCSQHYNGNSCIDGGTPRAGLVMDNAGNLFGTTQYGGTTSDAGVVFRLTPNQDRTSWAQTVIHNFCSQGWQTCADGGQPMAEPIIDGAGSLIGATSYGGGSYGAGGAVYKLTPDQTRTSWAMTIIYQFCPQGHVCPNGAVSYAPLMLDGAGNLYGTTYQGGSSNEGVAFALSPTGSGWTESVLYSFCGYASWPTAGIRALGWSWIALALSMVQLGGAEPGHMGLEWRSR